MKTVTLFCFILSISFFSQAQVVGDLSLSGHIIKFKTSIGTSMWLDSMSYKFVKITLTEPYEIQQQLDVIQLVDPYYSNVAYFSVKNGDCQLFPLIINRSESRDSLSVYSHRHLEGLFLVDDFDLSMDSLVVTVTTHSGHMRQSQMHTFNMDYKVPFVLDPQIGFVQEIATKKWYKRWVKDHPGVFNYRENYQKYYSGCDD